MDSSWDLQSPSQGLLAPLPVYRASAVVLRWTLEGTQHMLRSHRNLSGRGPSVTSSQAGISLGAARTGSI